MSEPQTTKTTKREGRAPVMLRGASVMTSYRDALFDAANRAGMTPNEFVLQAAAEKLAATGRPFTGIFYPGDFTKAGYDRQVRA